MHAHAHDFGSAASTTGDFLSGCTAVLAELPLMIAVISAGILVSLWNGEGLPKVWLAFVVGLFAGTALALANLSEPLLIAYGSAIALGLLASASIKCGLTLMRLILFLAGLLPIAAFLAGHDLGTVPLIAYVGIFVTINIVLAVSAGVVAITLKKLPYVWAPISFRALASWLVAIAMISLALLLSARL